MARRSDNMDRYRERVAREEHRSNTWYPILFFFGLAVTVVHYILREQPSWSLYFGLTPALLCLAVVWGLWRAKEWARWVAGVLLAGLLSALIVHMLAERTWEPLGEVIFAAGFTLTLLHSDTKEHFALVRAGWERARRGGGRHGPRDSL